MFPWTSVVTRARTPLAKPLSKRTSLDTPARARSASALAPSVSAGGVENSHTKASILFWFVIRPRSAASLSDNASPLTAARRNSARTPPARAAAGLGAGGGQDQ